jgi:hypothetical protein
MVNILAIKEMQIKTTLKFHLTPVKMATIKNTNRGWEEEGGPNNVCTCK